MVHERAAATPLDVPPGPDVRSPAYVVSGYAKAPESGEHKIWGLTSWNRVFSQTGPVMAGSSLPAMKARCIRRLRQVTRRAGAQRRSREAA